MLNHNVLQIQLYVKFAFYLYIKVGQVIGPLSLLEHLNVMTKLQISHAVWHIGATRYAPFDGLHLLNKQTY